MRRFLVILAAVLVLAAPAPAGAADVHVSAFDSGDFNLFGPSDVRLQQGDTVVFDFDGPSGHTATDETGMALYDSGVVLADGPSFSYRYVAAGAYVFTCTLHPEMDGIAFVPVVVRPGRPATGESVTIRWSVETAAPGFVYDVQIRRPGGAWEPWRTDVTVRRDAFTPGRKGEFRFRARMRTAGADAASRWSAPAVVRVG